MADQLIRATAADNGIRAVGVITTDLTNTARQRHNLSPLATDALGRTMAAGLMLASSMKQPQARVSLRIRGSGPLRGLMVDAGRNGTVRGYVHNPLVDLPPNEDGHWDVGTALGSGYLFVMRDVGYGQPFNSTVELVTGEVGDDITYFLAHSEQTPSAMALGVFADHDGVQAAGGLLIQVLPKAARDLGLVELLESRCQHLTGFTPLLRSGKSLPEILEDLLGDLGLSLLPETQDLRFFCPCSFDRVLGALKMLGQDELQDMIQEDDGAEATCDFCGEVYQANANHLEDLIQELRHEAAGV
ncbi:MAG: Hsp33 family molecular chaperone HslO [Prochlorothrix sp.]|nr:Hsp33 family molecular chaperone HslO [Prochlorothrix sp.]